MQLTPHFTLEELCHSDIAERLGIPNDPGPDELANLAKTAQGMETVRAALGAHPILVHSGFRSHEVNAAVGGVPNSAHCDGMAVDFVSAGFENYDAALTLARSQIPFDQLILEYGWVHISFDPRARRQVMTKKSAASPYQVGLVA
jgi:zinc D-Ala-D-Ala carboxypeptidase